jgi:N-acetylglutamate synthase/N-acetylornithine aminotransferase
VKTAFYQRPNLGRILAAVVMGINDLDQTRIDNLDDVLVAKTAVT